ncbi:MAG: type II secretion system protein [Planctomycetes bacterium]|nr:type II secretion system protein [Planctomycetota bacterium]
MPAPSRKAFTIVELLVVISIITVLVGMLVPAIGGAQRRAHKMEESNQVRQVGVGWMLYSQSANDFLLPGYLEDGDGTEANNVQGSLGWNVQYKLPAALPDATTPGIVATDDAQSWPWRLLPYLNYDQDTMLDYADLVRVGQTQAWEMSSYELVDPEFFYPASWGVTRPAIPRPTRIALEPAFGYNALYLGGWYEMQELGDEVVPRHRFTNSMTVPDDGSDPQRVNVVARSQSTVRDTSRMVVFCSAARMPAGEYDDIRRDWPGSHYVVPPTVAELGVWGQSLQSPGSGMVEVLAGYENDTNFTPIPVGRHTGQAAVVHADLHTEPHSPGTLDDQRFWINMAANRNFKHTE